MNFKKLKILLVAVLTLVLALSLNFATFATNDDEDSDFVIDEIITNEDSDMSDETEEVVEPTTTKKPTTTKRPTTTRNNNTNVVPSLAPDDDSDFKIKLELNNDEDALEAEVDKEGLVAVPDAPKKEGFKFAGWYSDAELTERWDFLTSKADEDTVLYAKWEVLPDDSLYSISVSTNLGGVVKVSPNEAKVGEIVTITVEPDEGCRLVEGSLSINGKFIDEYSFEMPASDVIVDAQFENVEDVAANKDNEMLKENIGKIITVVAIAIVVVAVVVWLIVNRYRFLPEDEEDELFFVEPMTNQPAIRHDDFVRNKRNQANSQNQDDDNIDIINEAEIRKINKTGNINLDQ